VSRGDTSEARWGTAPSLVRLAGRWGNDPATRFNVEYDLVPGRVPRGLCPLTPKPRAGLVNGLKGIDRKLEAELAELPEDEASAFREGASALEEVVRRLFAALDLVSFFTAGDKETRAGTLAGFGMAHPAG